MFNSNFPSYTFSLIQFSSLIGYVTASDLAAGDDNSDPSLPGDRGDQNENDDSEDTLVAREGGGEEDDNPSNVDGREDRQRPDDNISQDGREGLSENDNEKEIDQSIEKQKRKATCIQLSHQNEKDDDEDNGSGSLTIRKVFMNTIEPNSGIQFRITPNPYTLDGSLIVNENDDLNNIDCSPRKGVIILEDIAFSAYNIQEIRPTPSNDGLIIIHEADLYIHENLVDPVINFVERPFNSITTTTVDNDDKLQPIPDQYIVAVNGDIEERDINSLAQEFADIGAQVLHTYEDSSIFKGFTINIKNNREDIFRELENDSRIAFIEQDKMGQIALSNNNEDNMISAISKEYEIIPRGIDRIDADLNNIFSSSLLSYDETASASSNIDIDGEVSNNTYQNGLNNRQVLDDTDVDVDIAILDTGISFTHPDLNVYQGINFVNSTKSADDDQGHGSHIAGTAAGNDNSLGMIGTAPGARLWAVKVCDGLGNCPVSSQIKGIEYVTMHSDEIDVVNISIENPLSRILDRTINRSIIEGGVTYVVAAGNSGKNASLYSPASNPSVITVSAISDSDGKCGGIGRSTFIGQDDTFANFSNFGPAIDIAAPGVDIFSTYNGTEYAIYTGTSTAAPHVTGAAALYKATNPLSSPYEVYDALMASTSISSTKCNGNGHGYFQEDIDDIEEPLLYLGDDN